MDADLAVEIVRALFTYEPETGVLRWRNRTGRWGRIPAGSVAGTPSTGGYLQVRVDNRVSNLRDVSWEANTQNIRRANSLSTHGWLGVQKTSSPNRWKAAISVKGKQRHLGTFGSPEEAHKRYLSAKRELHEGCTL